jgi:integrase
MKRKLTDRFLQTVKAPVAGRLVVADTEVRGLTFRMTPLGVRSFMVRYRVREQEQQYFTIGTYPGTSLTEARQRARDIVAAAKRRVDLIAEERGIEAERLKAAATTRSMQELAAEYIDHAKCYLRRWRDVEIRLMKHVLPTLGDRPAASIRRVDIVELLDAMEARGMRQQVNRVRSTLSTMFAFAIERQYVETSPVAGTKRRKVEVERGHILDDDELRAIWQALDELPNPGLRDSVVGAHDRRLGDYVFTVSGDRPWTAIKYLKAELDRRSGVTGWRFHDIRRTVRSRLAELRVPFEVAERVLNHAMTKLERVYNRHAYREEKAAALQLWADRLAVIVGEGREAPNVVEFKPPST